MLLNHYFDGLFLDRTQKSMIHTSQSYLHGPIFDSVEKVKAHILLIVFLFNVKVIWRTPFSCPNLSQKLMKGKTNQI